MIEWVKLTCSKVLWEFENVMHLLISFCAAVKGILYILDLHHPIDGGWWIFRKVQPDRSWYQGKVCHKMRRKIKAR